MEVESIAGRGRNIYVKGKMMGQVPMEVVLGPTELRQTLRLLSFPLAVHAIRMLFLRPDKR